MPVYTYRGVTNAGKNVRGSVSADTARAARQKMRLDGVFLTELAESGEVAIAGGGAGAAGEERGRRFVIRLEALRRIPTIERAMATRQLATLVGAGIPLVGALGALVEQVEHARLRAVLAQVRERVNEGASLADALSATREFDTLYVSMIRAGEESGALDTVLARIADYLEDSVRLTNKVTSILIYPAVMLAFALGVIGVLVTVVLPQITSLLQSLDQPLPFYTRWIINSSEFVRSYWWALALGAVAIGIGFRQAVQTERGRAIWDRAKLRMPVFGRVNRVLSIARFSRTLSTLLGSGVPIVRALDISRHVANNVVLAEAIESARVSVTEGAGFAKPLRASGEFPAMVVTMVEVGEQSGELDRMLAKVSDTYDEQVENTVTRLTSLLEPLLILIMVGIVLVIILATLMPLLQITSSIQ